MKKALGFVSFVLIVGGISGLVSQWTGHIRLFGFLRYLIPHGYETYFNIAYVALGLAIGAAANATK